MDLVGRGGVEPTSIPVRLRKVGWGEQITQNEF